MKTQTQPQGKRYKVLIDMRDDESGKAWRPGQYVNEGDLPAGVIHAFSTMEPPVLELVKAKDKEADDGSDA